MSKLTHGLARATRATGLDVARLAGGGIVLRRRRGEPMVVATIGDHTSVVTTESDPGQLQRGLGHHLAQQQVNWVLDALDINCVLDVGANVGQFAGAIRDDGFTGRIVSFEPLPQFLTELGERAADDPDWRVLPYALGDADTTTEINVSDGTMSSILPSSRFGRRWRSKLRETHQETIEVRRLDGLFEQAVDGITDPRVFLKLDTQGYDLFAFRGAGDRIKQIPALMSEVCSVPIYQGMPRLTEQIAEYESAGFQMSGMYPVSLHQRTLRVIEFDAVMVRPEAVTSA